MVTKKTKEIFPETTKTEEVNETLTPSQYFESVKEKMETETQENIKRLYNVAIDKLKKYIITGQSNAAKELYAKCLYLEKESKLLEKGVNRYVLRQDIEEYIENVADECVCVIEMRNFDRPIPDEIIDVVSDTMDIFDEFFIVFTDYTGEKRSKVEKERRDKDPILFGNIFVDGKVSPKMYFIGDWIDEYCDLTLDKMIEALASKTSNEENKDKYVYDISNPTTLDEIETALFGSSKRLKAREVSSKKEV